MTPRDHAGKPRPLSKTQVQALKDLVSRKGKTLPCTLGAYKAPTVDRLLELGLIEKVDPEPYTWAASPGWRRSMYQATPKGIEAIQQIRRDEDADLAALLKA